MLFRGKTHRALDEKGRLVLPPEFRETLAARCREGTLVLTTIDGCVSGYPLPDWEILEEKFNALPISSMQMRDFKRMLIGGAETLSVDKQGRVQISQAHRRYAGLTKDIVVVGQGRTFEIWDEAKFDERTSQNFDEVYKELAENGINFF